jgi:hypothetical protein
MPRTTEALSSPVDFPDPFNPIRTSPEL